MIADLLPLNYTHPSDCFKAVFLLLCVFTLLFYFSVLFVTGSAVSLAGLQLETNDKFGLLILLSPPSECWDYRHVPPCLAHAVLGSNPGLCPCSADTLPIRL